MSKENNEPKRKRIFLFTISLLLMIISVVTVKIFLLLLPALEIKRVFVVDSAGRMLPEAGRVFTLGEDKNLFNLDIKKVAARIQSAHPEFISVFVRRDFPETLIIIIKKREPVAVVNVERTYLVDEEGFILPFDSRYADLVQIVDYPQKIQLYAKHRSIKLQKALSLIKELKQTEISSRYNIAKIDLRRYGSVDFYCSNGIKVKMGQDSFKHRVALLDGILSQIGQDNAVPKYIDMRFDNPIIKME
ncbi:MAG: cell division protein FtsQ/DivIB [Candidatus Omnitrophota bacterium]